MPIVKKPIALEDITEALELLEEASDMLRGRGCCSNQELCEWHQRYHDISTQYQPPPKRIGLSKR
jgi:hypothetical protein